MGFCLPTHEEFLGDIRHHYETIRNYAQKTGGNLYAFGWMLDIARCLYTLQRDEVISKTQAGEWALREGLCPEKAVMEEVLRIRGDPEAAVRDADTMFWAKEMGPHVQKFADVLEAYLAEE